MGYIKHKLDIATIDAAMTRSAEVGVLKGSHRKEAANLVGSIGEIVFESCMKQHGIFVEDLTGRTDMDFRLQDRFTVDVKTKDRTVFPKAEYDNSVPLYNHEHQTPDYFFFISLVRDKAIDKNSPYRFTHACLVGSINKTSLDERGQVWKKMQLIQVTAQNFGLIVSTSLCETLCLREFLFRCYKRAKILRKFPRILLVFSLRRSLVKVYV